MEDVPNYVMVPVPDTLVPQVMRHILHLITQDVIVPWDQPAIDDVFARVDELGRTILSSAARAQAAGETTTVDVIAEGVGLPIGEVVNRIRALNEMSPDVARPALVGINITNETLPNGREARRRFVEMGDAVAAMVVQAEQAERSAAPHPLQDS